MESIKLIADLLTDVTVGLLFVVALYAARKSIKIAEERDRYKRLFHRSVREHIVDISDGGEYER